MCPLSPIFPSDLDSSPRQSPTILPRLKDVPLPKSLLILLLAVAVQTEKTRSPLWAPEAIRACAQTRRGIAPLGLQLSLPCLVLQAFAALPRTRLLDEVRLALAAQG